MEDLITNPAWSKFIFEVVQSIIFVVIAAVLFVTKRTSANHSEIVSIEERLIKVEASVATKKAVEALSRQVAAHVAGSPNKRDIAEIHRRINEVMACVKKMEGELGGVKNLTDTLHKAHIDN